MELKRDPIKYVRDAVKIKYNKGDRCRICDSRTELQFHHYSSISLLWHRWTLKNKVVINNTDDMDKYKYVFIDEHLESLTTGGVTLCSECHNNRLHKIYGKAPALGTAKKQERWVDIQRVKNGLD